MTEELARQYRPADVEPAIAAKWDAARAFHADPNLPGEPYAIVIPPPNVTAALHMGHALNNTLQDILIRYHRMRGDNAMWMPGTDHAGIATQTVVEKRVLAEEGKKRTDFARDAFVAKIQAWKDEYEQRITDQLKAMGCSCDWERQRFTMDDMCARAVREAFFRLFRDGLIFRGKYLVNWDPVTQTVLADDEVENEEIDGNFYYMKYPLAEDDVSPGGPTHVTVATTRPETMLGDTAVAVNPKDSQRAHFIGKHVILPIVGRRIPIIGDDYVVIPAPPGTESADAKAKYASGFLKVTPAHDPNDYQIGLRHGLPMINVMAPDASISVTHGWDDASDECAPVIGLSREEARKWVVRWFKDHGLMEDIKPYRHAVGHSYRSHVPVEPYLSDQWYVRVTDDRLRGNALRAMAADQRVDESPPSPEGVTHPPERVGFRAEAWEGGLRFYPARYANTFRAWHENLRDWPISRQLWWGHRIPVWSRPKWDGENYTEQAVRAYLHKHVVLPAYQGNEASAKNAMDGIHCTYIGDSLHLCIHNTEIESAITPTLAQMGYAQDPDVLDTWFSSGLWPLSTLGWPDETPELQTWNPTNVLCTAREIITLWVSRMVMFNLYFRGQLPFKDVFIHAMIQDGEGRKMSKSLGNGVDPLDIIHSHGADAMRFTLASMTTTTQDVRMPVKRDEASGRNTSEKFDFGRNFANKLWNATRFALTKLSAHPPSAIRHPPSLADRWILSRTAEVIAQTTAALDTYDFHNYADRLYHFIWGDVCDWYIEAVKPTIETSGEQQRVLAGVLDVCLRLLHPAMPFITERLWDALNAAYPRRGVDGLTLPGGDLLVKAAWPTASESLRDDAASAQFERVRELVAMLREVRTQSKIPPRQTVKASLKVADLDLDAARPLIEALANVELVAAGPDVAKPANAAMAVRPIGEVYVHDAVTADLADAERDRLQKRLTEVERSIAALNGRLSNKGYTDKAPAHLVQQTRDELARAEAERDLLARQLAAGA